MTEEIQITEIEMCGICLEELELETKNYKAICGHSFHHNCIHKSMKKNNNCPYCRKELQTPSACCIYEIINYIMIQSDYADNRQTGVYAEIEDKDCYFTETEQHTLYFIMYIFSSVFDCNYNRLLLTHSYHNNIRFYPKKILADYKQIAKFEEYDNWSMYEYDNYQLNLDTNKIESYSGDQRKSNSVLLMNKAFEWNLYEKEYEKQLLEDYRTNNIN